VSGSEWQATAQRIQDAYDILESENPMTVRQLFYRLVSKGLITNCQAHYSRVSRDCTKARKDGRIDWEWIVDRTRPTYSPSVWADLAGYGRTIKHSYRKDYWEDQPTYVEIWLEKDSVSGSIQETTNELGVTMRAARGFNSSTRIREVAQHLATIQKPKYVYYLGDHDPSGKAMDDDQYKRVLTQAYDMLDSKRSEWGKSFYFARLAIFKEDITTYHLPPLKIKRDDDGKPTDSRSEKYLEEYGDVCVELDALPPDELRHRVRDAVESHIDMAKWNHALMIEKAELTSINDIVTQWQNVQS